MRAGQLPVDEQLAHFQAALRQNSAVGEVLARAAAMDLPGWYLVAGCLYQTGWNVVTGQPAQAGILDYDVAYFDDSDLDAGWGVKREEFWLGYKLHVTETCDDPPPCTCRPDPAAPQPAAAGADHDRGCARLVFPNLITSVATTVTDNQMTAAIDDDPAGKNLAPGRHYLDSGYLSAALVVSEAARHGMPLIGPLLAHTSAQARAGNGYARADFTIDYDRKTVTCPQGKTSATWTRCTERGKDAIVATFSARDCGSCPPPVHHQQQAPAAAHPAAPRPGRNPGRRPRRRNHDRLPGRLRPPGRRRGHHAPGRQPRRATRPLPRPAQDPPRPHVHGLRAQPAPAGSILGRHPARPAANQPPSPSRTQPCRMNPN
jgi:Nucleotidyltransferase